MSTVNWKKPKGGAWENAKNWDLGVPGQDDVASITRAGHYTVTLSSAQTVAELDVSSGATLLEESGGSLTTSKIEIDQATLDLEAANPNLTGTIDADDAKVIIGADDALGSASLTLEAGSILKAMVSTTLSDPITFGAVAAGAVAPAIWAATGTTLTLDGALMSADVNNAAVVFGASTAKGTIVLASAGATTWEHLQIAGGRVATGSEAAAESLGAASIEIAKHAILDLGDRTVDFVKAPDAPVNDGTITSAGGMLAFDGLSGHGKIKGDLAIQGEGRCTNAITLSGDGQLVAGDLELAGKVRIATGGHCTIGAGATLVLDKSGSFACPLSFDDSAGRLEGDQAKLIHITGQITGDGSVAETGPGVMELSAFNNYGDTYIQTGTILVDDGAAVGSGSVFISDGGTLSLGATTRSGEMEVFQGAGTVVERGNLTLGDAIEYRQGQTLVASIAAADGHSVAIAGFVTIDPGIAGTIGFGTTGDDGTVVLTPSGVNSGFGAGNYAVEVVAGTLRIGNSSAATEVGGAHQLSVEAGATLDMNGFATSATLLLGAGTITSTGNTLTVGGGSFSGAITGNLTVAANGTLTLLGGGSFATLAIAGGVTVTLGGAHSEHVTMTGGDDVTLALTDKVRLTGTIAGFGTNDAFDLQGVLYRASGFGATTVSYNASTHQLSVGDGNPSVVLTLDGAYASTDFKLSDDGHGHALISYRTVRSPTFGGWPPPAHAFGASEHGALAAWADAVHMIHDAHLPIA